MMTAEENRWTRSHSLVIPGWVHDVHATKNSLVEVGVRSHALFHP